jgi:hypothetical protein
MILIQIVAVEQAFDFKHPPDYLADYPLALLAAADILAFR